MNRSFLSMSVLFFVGIFAWYISLASRTAVIIGIAAYIIYLIIKGKYIVSIAAVLIPIAGFAFISVQNYTVTQNASLYYNTTVPVLAKIENAFAERDYSYADLLIYEAGNRKVTGKVRARVYGDRLTLSRGDVIDAVVSFYAPSEGNNFGDINTRLARMSKGIGLSGVFSDEKIKIVEKRLSYFSPFDLGYSIKIAVTKNIDKYFSGGDQGLTKALLLGDKPDVPKVIYEAFKTSGMSHMIAVSGMHINIILSFVTGLFALAGMKRSKTALWISLILMWLFVFITGCVPSSVRAGIMSTLLLLSFLTDKANDSLNSLGAAVLIILILSPASAFDSGFMLSVAATFSILVFSKPIKNKLGFLPDALGDILSVTLAGQIVTMPALTYMAGTVPLFGIVPNLLICPLLSFLMIICILAVLLGGVPVVGAACVFMVNTLSSGMSAAALIISRVPGASLVVGEPSVLRLVAFACTCVALYYYLAGKKIKTGAFAAAALCVYAVIFMTFVFSQTANFTFVNVKHGDCMIFKSNKITVMFDSGGSETSDVASEIIIPFLNKQGIHKIDVAFITHYHSDHCKSYINLIKKGRIKRIVLPNKVCDAQPKTEILNAAQISGVTVSCINGGEKFDFGGLEVLTFNTYRDDDINNGIVYAVSYGECAVCVTGDINKDGERRTVPFAAANPCDILKVPHHGSGTSSGSTFIKAVGASAAVISASKFDKIPSETRKALNDNVKNIYETSVSGTIDFKVNRKGFLSVRRMKE